METIKRLFLKKGREKPILRGHPWVFSGSIDKISGDIDAGDTVLITTSKGMDIAKAAYSPFSQISARIWTLNIEREIDYEFFLDRLNYSEYLRRTIINHQNTDAYRMVHAESDGIPGLVVDRYGENIVTQFLSTGAEKWKPIILEALKRITDPKCIYDRSDIDVRVLEGLEVHTGCLDGIEPVNQIVIEENSIKYSIDIKTDQKTGFYLDQRDNRKIVGKMAKDLSVLDCFSGTGGFLINTINNGAKSVTAIESSQKAIDRARNNLEINHLDDENVHWIRGDVFAELRLLRDQNRKFDLVILDPPKFAPTVTSASKALRGYKDINLLAMKLINDGGYLATFSCSGGVDKSTFKNMLRSAAFDARVNLQMVYQLSQSPDHPVSITFPEGEYLKGIICRVGIKKDQFT